MAKILAVYGTHYGQTKKIVTRLGKLLAAYGHHVTAWQGDQLPEDFSIEEFDAFLVAGSVHFGRHQVYLRDFVRRHRMRLNTAPAAFISVCGALAGNWAPGPEAARGYLERFFAETGWAPSVSRSAAGAVAYTKYGFFTRHIMRFISAQTGRPTDTSRDWEFTDWDEIDRLGMELADRLAGSAVPLTTGA